MWWKCETIRNRLGSTAIQSIWLHLYLNLQRRSWLLVARAQTIESWCQFKTMRKCLRNMIRLVLFLAAVINNDDMWSMYSAKWRKICKSRLINTIDARILLQSQLRSPIIINTLWSIYMKQYTVAVKIMWIHHTSVRMFKIDLTQSLFHSSFS